jgi:hypothetical protein
MLSVLATEPTAAWSRLESLGAAVPVGRDGGGEGWGIVAGSGVPLTAAPGNGATGAERGIFLRTLKWFSETD